MSLWRPGRWWGNCPQAAEIKPRCLKQCRPFSDLGYLKVAGLEKCGKSYARKFVPALTKAEYYTEVMMKRGMDSSSLPGITAAFLGVTDKSDQERDAEVIAKLEEIINALRKVGEKDLF